MNSHWMSYLLTKKIILICLEKTDVKCLLVMPQGDDTMMIVQTDHNDGLANIPT